MLLAQAQRRRPTLLPPQLLRVTMGGGGCFVSSPAVSLGLCVCCLTPAADRHQAKLFQLTLGCINNGLLYALSSTDTFRTARRKSLFFSFFYIPLRFRFHKSAFLNEQGIKDTLTPHALASVSAASTLKPARRKSSQLGSVCSASAGCANRQLMSSKLEAGTQEDDSSKPNVTLRLLHVRKETFLSPQRFATLNMRTEQLNHLHLALN